MIADCEFIDKASRIAKQIKPLPFADPSLQNEILASVATEMGCTMTWHVSEAQIKALTQSGDNFLREAALMIVGGTYYHDLRKAADKFLSCVRANIEGYSAVGADLELPPGFKAIRHRLQSHRQQWDTITTQVGVTP
jgi:hypothetical protein